MARLDYRHYNFICRGILQQRRRPPMQQEFVTGKILLIFEISFLSSIYITYMKLSFLKLFP